MGTPWELNHLEDTECTFFDSTPTEWQKVSRDSFDRLLPVETIGTRKAQDAHDPYNVILRARSEAKVISQWAYFHG